MAIAGVERVPWILLACDHSVNTESSLVRKRFEQAEGEETMGSAQPCLARPLTRRGRIINRAELFREFPLRGE